MAVPPPAVAAPGASTPAMELQCTVTVATATLSCERPAGGARGDLYLGGQGVRVKLASSNRLYDAGTSTLQADVTVQNLLTQPIGTPDGATVSGVKVFFHALPAVTGGKGTVSVQNADGTATFTAANQPYFLYEEILHPLGTSAAKPWKFTVPESVTTFTFSVYVAAALPIETGVLRWTRESGVPIRYFPTGAWGTSDSSVFVTSYDPGGLGGSVSYWNGHAWIDLLATTAMADVFKGISGTSERDLWVTTGGSKLLHYTGNAWTSYIVGSQSLNAVWAATPTRAFAVGAGSAVARWNGSTWTPMSVPPQEFGTPPVLRGVWGSSPTDVFAVGDTSAVLHYDGVEWTWMDTGTDVRLTAVWGSSATDVWAVGSGSNGTSTLHYDGTGWQAVPTNQPGYLFSVWGSGANEVYAVGADPMGGTLVLMWNGTEWSRVSAPSAPGAWPLQVLWGTADGHFVALGEGYALLRKAPGTGWLLESPTVAFNAVEAISASDVYAVGEQVRHWDGSAWSTVLTAPAGQSYYDAAWDGSSTVYVLGYSSGGTVTRIVNGVPGAPAAVSAQQLNGVWAASASNVFVVGTAGTILRSTGGAFTPMTSGTSQALNAVWGSSATDVFAVGANGVVRHYNGTSWSSMASGTTVQLKAVHGTGPGDVWAVGAGTLLHYDGTAWSKVAGASPADLKAVWAAPGGVVYVAGYGALLRYANGTWSTDPGLYYLTSLGGLAGGDVYAAGNLETILHGQR